MNSFPDLTPYAQGSLLWPRETIKLNRMHASTTLANGYYLATRKLTRVQCGGEQTWKEFKANLYCERDPREMFVWCVCNGTAHLLNVNAFHLLKNAELSEMTPRVAAILAGKTTAEFLKGCGL